MDRLWATFPWRLQQGQTLAGKGGGGFGLSGSNGWEASLGMEAGLGREKASATE